MIFQIKHTKQNLFGRNFFKIFIIFLIILVFVLIFNIFGPARSLASEIFSPFFKTGNFFYERMSQIPKIFADKNKLIEENKKLLAEVENSRLDIIDYESIKYENQKLRRELEIRPEGNFIAASIIAKSPQIPPDSLFLDKGFKDGLNNGDLVLAGERILIGKIAKMSKNRAMVALNSFANAVSYGYVARTNEPLEINGGGGGRLETKVAIDFDIIAGDKIMVADSFTYLAAIVGVVEEDQSSGFKNIFMSLPVDVSKISIVFIEPLTSE